jgi:hypothetical protein
MSTGTSQEITSAAHFTDERIAQIQTGECVLSAEEREFLVTDTARMEECWPEREEDLRKMSDSELMSFAYRCWADYASGQV